MKIAFVSDDGERISAHFGRASGYSIVTIEEGKETRRERRPKPVHHRPGEEHGAHEHAHEAHGHGPAQAMLEPIRDCQLLVTRGMGTPAYEAARAAGLEPIVTDLAGVDEALSAYLAGSLANHPERLH